MRKLERTDLMKHPKQTRKLPQFFHSFIFALFYDDEEEEEKI